MDGSGKHGAKMMANDRMFRAMVEDEPLQFLAEAEQTMAMSAVAKRWTGSEVRALIEANPLHTPRYELIDGESLAQPDVFVIPPLPVPRPRKTRQLKKLLLAIEVISPSSHAAIASRSGRTARGTACPSIGSSISTPGCSSDRCPVSLGPKCLPTRLLGIPLERSGL